MKKRKGFTLVELIGVISILGILSVVLLPNIIGYIYKAKIARAQTDAGIIINAIDVYEAENAHKDQANIVVSRNSLAGSVNNEDTLTLDVLITRDSTFEIFGGDAASRAVPDELTSDGISGAGHRIAQIKISDLRKMAYRQNSITLNNIFGARIDKVDGINVGY